MHAAHCPVHAPTAPKTAARPTTQDPHRHHLAKAGPEVRQAIAAGAAAIATVLKRIFDAIVRRLRNTAIDLSSRPAIATTIGKVFSTHRTEYDDTLVEVVTDGGRAGRAQAVRRYDLDVPDDELQAETVRALRDLAFTASGHTRARMQGDISEAIAEAYEEGLSLTEITERLENEVFSQMSGYESRRIARTEINAASSRGALAAYTDAGASHKRWQATYVNTRASHIKASGQEVLINQPFAVGGYQAQYPGAPNLPVEERANCRCFLIPNFGE